MRTLKEPLFKMLKHCLTRKSKRLVLHLLSRLSPRYMRRMIYIVTVYHYLLNDYKNSKLDSLNELNKELSLVNVDARALKLPGFFTETIWKDEEPVCIDDIENNKDVLMERLMEKLPTCLKYGRKQDVSDDLEAVFKFVKSRIPMHA